MPFVNRDPELRFLLQRFESGRPELLVIYGRRRTGKTELLKRFCEERSHVFFVGNQTTAEEQLADFSQVLTALPGSPLPEGARLGNWRDALKLLGDLARDRRFVAVFDEFPYLLASTPTLASLLQNIWDHELGGSGLMLILCGSHVGVMESDVLGQGSPLYGRRTGQWRLRPLLFKDVAGFLPTYSLDDRARSYGVVGGMPAYLGQFEASRPLDENVVIHILSRGSFLYDEVQFLLVQELRDVSRYHAALSALAAGATQQHEIARAMFGPGGGNPVQYLNRLRDLYLVERVVPATVKNPERTKTVIYRISDPFVRFWFRFAAPNRSALEQGRGRDVWLQRISPSLDDYMGPIFEEIGRQYAWSQAEMGDLPFVPDHIGPWWDGEEEIDVVAVRHDTREAWLAECTWSGHPLHPREHEELQRKAAYFQTKTGYVPRGLGLYARGGFSDALRERTQRHNLQLVSLADIA